MSIALRIDSITPVGSGTVILGYTFGSTPLPAQSSGRGVETSVAKLQALLDEINPEHLLIVMGYALWKAANPALNNPGLIVGKILTVNPGNAASPMVVS